MTTNETMRLAQANPPAPMQTQSPAPTPTPSLAPAQTLPPAAAPSSGPPPLDAAGQARLKVLSEELRCLVCQNQTLADSHAELAIDLRNQVQELIAEGKSNDEIKRYLVERYGDFVLYRPPVQSNTALLWGGPFALLAGGGLIWALVQRRSRLAGRLPATASSAASPQPSESGRSSTGNSAASGSTSAPGSPAPSSAHEAALKRARNLLDDR